MIKVNKKYACCLLAVLLLQLCFYAPSSADAAKKKQILHKDVQLTQQRIKLSDAIKVHKVINKIRVTWDSIPNAVMYELIVSDSNEFGDNKIKIRKEQLPTNGCELDMAIYGYNEGMVWQVRGVDINNKPISDFTEPAPLSQQEINPDRPKLTTNYDKMPYPKMYPVYSWIPVLKAAEYELQVYYDADNDDNTTDTLIKTEIITGSDSFDSYDWSAYRRSGTYWWRVRARNSYHQPIGSWSARSSFRVEQKAGGIAALGDSITHGGGAVNAPPSDSKYDWETYAGLPIRNLGVSGNTVENMLDRFDTDVLPFKPRVLVVFGGINNIRVGASAAQVINSLTRIKYKCLYNNIAPVFVTIAPINPSKMLQVTDIQTVTPSWKEAQQQVNTWIKKQEYHIDITYPLTDKQGLLKANLSTDGLHPDVTGKKMIGMGIGNYIKETFHGL